MYGNVRKRMRNYERIHIPKGRTLKILYESMDSYSKHVDSLHTGIVHTVISSLWSNN